MVKKRGVMRAPVAIAAGLGLLLTLTACGNDGSGAGDGGGAAADDGAAGDGPGAGLPEEVRERGYLTVAGDASYPPIGMMDEDGTTIVGLDSDLAHAMSEVLGVELRMVNSSFDAIIPGLQGGKFDMGMSWMNDTEERRNVVDFINYSQDGSSFLVPADATDRPESLADLCGLSVAVQSGTVQHTDAETQRDTCEAEGQETVDVQVFPDQNAANLALNSGRADVSIADTPVAVWQVDESGGRFELSGEPYGEVHHGIAVPKDSPLAEPVGQAMQELIDNGTYAEIFEKWGLSDAAIDQVLINDDPIGQ